MRVPSESTPLQPKPAMQLAEDEVGLDSWICCRAVAGIELPQAERHRTVLMAGCFVGAGVGVLLASIGFLGGYSQSSSIVSLAPWITGKVDQGWTFNGGIRYICVDGRGDGAGCHPWSREGICQTRTASEACEACKVASGGLVFSALIAMVTYVTFVQKTRARFKGEDTPMVKFIASVMTMIGALNFTVALITYHETCIKIAKNFQSVDVRAGFGYKCILLATVLKVVMGGIHLVLPVRPYDATAMPAWEDKGK